MGCFLVGDWQDGHVHEHYWSCGTGSGGDSECSNRWHLFMSGEARGGADEMTEIVVNVLQLGTQH